MKRLLAYLFIVLGLGFTFNVSADDVRDFEIEGISIGDSLLDHFKIKTIKSARKYEYKNTKFYSIDIWSDKFNQYAAIQFHLKEKDKKYVIHSLSGTLIFGKLGIYDSKSNDECKNKKKLIMDSINSVFPSADVQSYDDLDADDGYGQKALRSETYYRLDLGEIWIQCVTWGKKTKKKENLYDNLRFTLLTPEFIRVMDSF
jgi:hypothetical protein|tara:strand:+ start:450 stop:1052 length:603 start_codon:yes stop_codon:yes gene_type:complete